MGVSLWSRVLDFVSPRLCAVCGSRLSVTEHALCSACCLRLPRTGFCLRPYDNPVAQAFWGQADVERAASFFYFEPHSEVSRMIYSLKYKGRPDIGVALGRLAAGEFMAAGFFDGVDVIVPVPLARKRLRERGYNQSAEVAAGVSSLTGIPVDARSVCRKAFKTSQTKLGRWKRLGNVSGLFEVRRQERLLGKHVLLVDDVFTTGATVMACASAVAAVPGTTVSIMTLGFTK